MYFLTSLIKLTMQQLQASKVCQLENKNKKWYIEYYESWFF